MPIRSLIDGGSYPPETLAVIYEAFDLAWADVAAIYGDDESRKGFARTSLARAVMSAAQSEVDSADQLKVKALEVFETMGLGRG